MPRRYSLRIDSSNLFISSTSSFVAAFLPFSAKLLFVSIKEAFEHFRQKEKFQTFDENVLRDYVKHGTIESENKVKLFFEPKIEAEIYRTIPHNLPRLKGKLKVSAFYIGGTRSREAKLARLAFMKKHFPFKFRFVEGSHLFPLEKPRQTAEIIRQIILSKAL